MVVSFVKLCVQIVFVFMANIIDIEKKYGSPKLHQLSPETQYLGPKIHQFGPKIKYICPKIIYVSLEIQVS